MFKFGKGFFIWEVGWVLSYIILIKIYEKKIIFKLGRYVKESVLNFNFY